MNEILFLLHIALCIGLILMALRIGKYALVSLIALQAIFANLFVVKQMSLFGFAVTCSDVFAIGGILTMNLLQEFYGKAQAQIAIRCAFLGLVFFMVMSKIHLAYLPLAIDTTHDAFATVLSSTTRISLASIAVYYVVQKLDVRLFGVLQSLFSGKYLPLRVGMSLVITQFLDTVLFSFLGLYGIVDSVWDIIFLSFAVKCIIISLSSVFVAVVKKMEKYVPV